MTPTTVFVSYSHRDEQWKDRILVHLSTLKQKVSISVWDDTRIPLGSDWAANLEAELTTADVAILLLSADFLSSDFIRQVEIPALLAREAAGKVRLLPILLRPCAWQTVPWLANRVVNPVNAKALSSLGFAEVEYRLSTIFEEVLGRPGPRHLRETVSGVIAVENYYDDGRGGRTPENAASSLAAEAAARALPAATEYPANRDTISIGIEGPDGRRFALSEVPTSMTVRELARAVVNEYPLLADAVVDLQTSDGTHRRLAPEQTLNEENVQDGASLQARPVRTAGCFPIDTLVNVPDGEPVALGSLKVGDRVASPQPYAEQESIAVVDEIVREHATRLIIINDLVRITPEHGLFCVSRRAWVRASELRLGDFLLRGDRRVVAVRTLAIEDTDVEVANLVLRRTADVFVANGFVVFGARKTAAGALVKSAPR